MQLSRTLAIKKISTYYPRQPGGVFYCAIFLTFAFHTSCMKYLFLFLAASFCVHAQVINKTDFNKPKDRDTLVVDNGKKDSLKIFKPTIADYRYRTQYGDEQAFDTTFAVQRSYIFSQYNNRDNFGKIQFANIGSGFQDLVFRVNPEQNLTLLPTNKSHFIIGANDVKYYDVKTPTTSFVYHSAMRNGAALQSTYTQNFGKNFNFAAEYMGLRSQGFYDNSLAASNNTLFSGHYTSKNTRYEAYAHYLHQNVNNQENGGISDLDIFFSGDSRFNNRENFAVNLNNTNSRYSYRRYYLSQSFAPFDTERFPFKVKHTVFHQGNKYYFNLDTADAEYYGTVSPGIPLNSKKYSYNLNNTVSLLFDKEKFFLEAGVRHQMLTLGADHFTLQNSELTGLEEKENRIGAVGTLRINLLEKFAVHSFLEYSNGKHFGNYLRSQNKVRFEPVEGYFVDAHLNFQSAAPSFNYLLNGSPITGFNYNFSNFKNESILEIGGIAGLKWFDAKIFAHYYRIDNYVYFNASGAPAQSGTSVNISQVGAEADFGFGKFHLNGKALFQGQLTNKELYPVPNFIGRANFYWQSKAFKDAAEIMAGIKVYYFTKFKSRAYLPVLNEFILPGSGSYAIGGQPIADAYFNMKVKTMQFFIEAQHFNTTFMQNKSFTAPYYPVYDFRLNIGIVWNLFH